jgi:hypothetical protein
VTPAQKILQQTLSVSTTTKTRRNHRIREEKERAAAPEATKKKKKGGGELALLPESAVIIFGSPKRSLFRYVSELGLKNDGHNDPVYSHGFAENNAEIMISDTYFYIKYICPVQISSRGR